MVKILFLRTVILLSSSLDTIRRLSEDCVQLSTAQEISVKNMERIIHKAEKLLIESRMLYSQMNIHQPEEIDICTLASAEILGINVERKYCDNNTFYHITIPIFIPNKRSSWELYKKTIGLSVGFSISDFCKRNSVTPISNSAVLFVNWYNNNKIYINDNDNKEMSIILNAISGINGIIKSDNGVACSVHCESYISESNSHTDIYVTEQSKFADFYYQLQKQNYFRRFKNAEH